MDKNNSYDNNFLMDFSWICWRTLLILNDGTCWRTKEKIMYYFNQSNTNTLMDFFIFLLKNIIRILWIKSIILMDNKMIKLLKCSSTKIKSIFFYCLIFLIGVISNIKFYYCSSTISNVNYEWVLQRIYNIYILIIDFNKEY